MPNFRLATLLSAGFLACAPGTAGTTAGTATATSSSGSASTSGSATSGPGFGATTGAPAPTSITITPAGPTLNVTSGAATTLQMSAVANTGATVSASWSLDRADIAAINASGLLSAAGPLGGLVAVTAVYGGLSATTQVQVVVTQDVYAGTTPSQASAFGAAPTTSATSSPAFLYPSDGVVIPVNLQALNFQWQAGTGNDLFVVELNGAFGVLDALVSPTNPAQPSWQPDEATWNAFAQSNIGQTVTLTVLGAASAVPGVVYHSTQQHITLAPSRFAGTIYYWTVSGPGQVLKVGASGVSTPVYTPPTAPASASPPGNTCMGCHTVSRDGTQMSAELWGAAQPLAGVVLNLSQATAVPTVPDGYSWMFSTFDDTGDLLVTSWMGALTLRASSTAEPVPTGSGEGNLAVLGCGDGGACSQPTWSADGLSLLFTNSNGYTGHFSYDVDFDVSDLSVARWSATTQTFAAPTTLVANDYDGQALANFHPTVSIDNQLVAFNRGPCSRSDGSSECATTCPTVACATPGNVPPGKLELVALDGGTPVELVNAEGGDTRNWFPNFSPFKEGGYHWLAFFSLRDYGWITAGQNLRQIWVTAVDDVGNPTADPSHPGFWLPGQDATTINDKAEWAPEPCVGQGTGCQGDIDCCSGLVCRATDAGITACIPTAQACGYDGSSCQSASNCCSPFLCQNGTCGVSFK